MTPAPGGRRRRTVLATVAVAAIFLGLVGGWWLFYRPSVEVVVPAAAPPPAPPRVAGPDPAAVAALDAAMDAQRRANADAAQRIAALEEQVRSHACPEPPPPPPPQPKPPPPPPPPKPQAELEADRWNKGDLTILEGCWRLGKDSQSSVSFSGRTEVCTNKAGQICFGRDGRGTRTSRVECRGGQTISCEAPINGSFSGDRLQTTQRKVRCQPATFTWDDNRNAMTCRRVNDSLAICRDAEGFEHEFRR